MNFGRWLHSHSLKLLAIRDTPQAIAGGVAIGIFLGFTPLWGLKTLLSILFAWVTGSNILAAVIAGQLHDVIIPFMPLIWRFEYEMGYWILSNPHQFPPHIHHSFREWVQMFLFGSWRERMNTLLFGVGRPWLVGSVVFGAPLAVVSYFLTRTLVARHQEKKRHHQEPAQQKQTNLL